MSVWVVELDAWIWN